MAPRLSLEQVTAWGLAPDAYIALAASLRCEAISLFIETPVPEAAGPPVSTDKALRREVKARLNDSGVRLHAIECFALAPETDVAAFAPSLAAGAELGGVAATAIVFDPDRARTADRLGQLAELAHSFGLDVNVEFIAQSALPSLSETVSLVRQVGAPGLRIVLDPLHWTRSGGTVADLRTLDPALIGWIQFCDGPATMPVDLQLFHEGFLQRQIPGEGAFALGDFLGALPPDRMIGVEVPLKDLADQGIPVEERARRAVEATRHLLKAHGYAS